MDNKEKILNNNQENNKNKHWMRYIRELRDDVIDWENVRQSTREIYKLRYDEKKINSEIDPRNQ